MRVMAWHPWVRWMEWRVGEERLKSGDCDHRRPQDETYFSALLEASLFLSQRVISL